MAFEATKREWGELYAFFRLLADGYVYAGTPEVKKNEAQRLPVAMIQREEHDGTRRYIIESEENIHICGEKIDKLVAREDFSAVVELILSAVKASRENDVMSPDGVEEFLDEVAIFDLEAKTDDRTDFYVAFYSADAPLTGFCVRSRLSSMFPLLDGGRTANLKFEQTGIKFAKLYAPAVILGTLSITSILASNNILRKRNVALGAAYAAIDKSFKEYRSRVVERFGEQVDQELKYNIKAKKFEEVEVDPETGKEKKVKKTVQVVDPNLQSDYAVYFDSKSRNYETNQDYNRMFLKAQQAFANDKLQTRGHLFLNEVLDDLDLPRTPAGQIVGWTADGPDGYVNFRIVEVERETEDGRHEPVLLLDFNVEGNIWEKM